MELIKTIKTICVEDVARDKARLEHLLISHPFFDYIRGFDSADDCLEYLTDHQVDLIFLDIELEGKSGLWLANKIKHLPIAVVFLTAYSNYALQAFDACALDYIIKPVLPEHLEQTLEHIRLLLLKGQNIIYQKQVQELHDNYLIRDAVPTRIFLNFVGETHVIELADIIYFTTVARYTHIYLADGTRHISSKKLNTYMVSIDKNPDFLRIHRSTVINRKYVKRVLRDGYSNKHSVEMANGEVLKISSLKKNEIIEQVMR